MDTAALPSTTTSAEPLYISTEPSPPAASSGSAATLVAPPAPPALPASVTLESGRTATCPQKHCWRSWVLPRPAETEAPPSAPHPDLGVPAPVAVWQEHLQPNVKLDYPRTKGIGLLGVVLKGIVTVSPSEGAALAALDPWSAFSAPGAGLTLAADPSGASILLVAYPLEGSLDLAVAAVRKSEKAAFWDKRPGTFAVEDLERVERLSWAQDAAHAWVGFEQDRSPKAYLGLLRLDAKLSVAEHHHDESWEVIVPVQGAGALALSGERVTSNASAPRSVDVRPGHVIMIPPGVAHAYQPAGQEPLLAVQLFVPPGPQQRYRDLAQPNRGAP